MKFAQSDGVADSVSGRVNGEPVLVGSLYGAQVVRCQRVVGIRESALALVCLGNFGQCFAIQFIVGALQIAGDVMPPKLAFG